MVLGVSVTSSPNGSPGAAFGGLAEGGPGGWIGVMAGGGGVGAGGAAGGAAVCANAVAAVARVSAAARARARQGHFIEFSMSKGASSRRGNRQEI
jgi:hypothetical protein